MRYTFADPIFPKEVLPDIIDIIYDFAYKKTKEKLHYDTWTARQCSYLMPTPPSWKAFISDNGFNYYKFLRGDNIIDLESVKTALDLINWHSMRVKRCPIARYTRITTKSAIRRGLDNEYIRDNLVLMVWLLLTSCNVDDFRVKAFKGAGFTENCRVPMFTHPLSRYYPPRRNMSGIVTFLLDFNIIRAGI